MNRRMVAFFVGSVLRIEAVLMILPLVVSFIYGEDEWIYIAAAAVISFLVGYLLSFKKPKNVSFYTREGIMAVALSWIFMSVFGAIPMWHAVSHIGFTDALFETISGFTTTGASILTEVESLPKGLLFWRSFTHWVGGMGVLVFMLAILPEASGENIYLMRAESPGPSVGKLVPRVKSTAKILYLIYIGITLSEMIALMVAGMPMYDAVVITFGTVGTGGFAVTNNGCAAYTALQQGIITFFMIVCGANFNVYFLVVARKFKAAFTSEEVLSYLSIYAAATLCVAINARNMFTGFGEALHHSFFNVASVMTTTGFSTTDFNTWPVFSRMMLLLCMFIGGCAGSTAGGIKVSRIVIGFKTIRKELQHLVHPRSVKILKFEGKPIEHSVLRGINVYFLTYILIFAVSILLVSLDGKDFTTTVTAVIATFNNIGPGLDMVGPMGNYSQFSAFAKYVLMFDMLAGRLELFPMLLIFMPMTFRRQK
ncbi:MAG: TrkH family potassium uptake protein [Lachnospiraceae bacterium]|nr:TrkH family potassium uptake protein [Lachnospiraceae bacterium]